jgi:four helix bundle protein
MNYSFEKLEVWTDARELTRIIYKITRGFPDDERFGIINQMRRAAISVSSNIVEGSYRSTGKRQIKFYDYSIFKSYGIVESDHSLF